MICLNLRKWTCEFVICWNCDMLEFGIANLLYASICEIWTSRWCDLCYLKYTRWYRDICIYTSLIWKVIAQLVWVREFGLGHVYELIHVNMARWTKVLHGSKCLWEPPLESILATYMCTYIWICFPGHILASLRL